MIIFPLVTHGYPWFSGYPFAAPGEIRLNLFGRPSGKTVEMPVVPTIAWLFFGRPNSFKILSVFPLKTSNNGWQKAKHSRSCTKYESPDDRAFFETNKSISHPKPERLLRGLKSLTQLSS